MGSDWQLAASDQPGQTPRQGHEQFPQATHVRIFHPCSISLGAEFCHIWAQKGKVFSFLLNLKDDLLGNICRKSNGMRRSSSEARHIKCRKPPEMVVRAQKRSNSPV